MGDGAPVSRQRPAVELLDADSETQSFGVEFDIEERSGAFRGGCGVPISKANIVKVDSNFPFESKFIEIERFRIHYIEHGRGAPILFVHGNPTSSYLWRNVLPKVAEATGRRGIALDLLGFGKSDKPEIDSIGRFSFFAETSRNSQARSAAVHDQGVRSRTPFPGRGESGKTRRCHCRVDPGDGVIQQTSGGLRGHRGV
ncbi:MAG: alpha/beta fold hydrolase [Betaproteobacteria bacterium]|nr:alpha/beta fold hydrolase [Betaproteobacteria bacterium]